jgi:hypothetical protein
MTTFRARLAVVLMVALTVAACSENTSSVTAPEQALYDGGHTFGGGNRSDTTTTTTTATSGEGAVVNGGGHTFGGGN